ncbi:DEAD/DEAH box helicase [Bradyrhizobium sp.]|jgi:SNF2 family DNA or RNA helicase|uniref:DEAD/DEAH box helicase n=1 Tax=Bradyrhizobium sp. TaxID=376 RepID=UPI002DDCB704|nr:DEAD/DEAH box helicase [Bradyrhizobium sp.]HEV2155807.1 DEAD/DEAH box helicase [Bradyrhizobium sp.]
MYSWFVRDGILRMHSPEGERIPSAEDIFRYFGEGDRGFVPEPVDESAVENLRFSKYPLQLGLSLKEQNGMELLLLNGTHRGKTVTIPDAAALDAGHFVSDDCWYPLDGSSAAEIRQLLVKNKAHPGERVSLQMYLAMRQAGVEPEGDTRPLGALSFLTPSDAKPQNVNATLYPYQLDGWRWCRFIAAEGLGGILADEMGLGKTLQVIGAIADPPKPREEPVLIVAPGSLLENWAREFRKFTPQIRTLKHHGPDRTGRPADLKQVDVVITSYDTVVRDNSLFMMISWSMLVCDEAQYVKNSDSLRARSVKRLRRSSAIAVTGTPVENRLTDLWSITDLVLPGYFGTAGEFQKRFEDDLDGAISLERLASPIMLRRRVSEVAKDLPERIDIPQAIELEEDEAKTYEAMREDIAAQFGASATLVALTRLRMFCSHPWLVAGTARTGDPASFSKYARLVDILEEIFQGGEKAILFTAYTEMTDMVVADIAKRFRVFTGYIDGRVPIDDRQPVIDRFSAESGPALLVLNPRAGGAGLNITAANHVIHYTLEWNPALEDQASARAYRRGQTRPVTVHRLFCGGTVEEVVDDRLARKRTLSETAVVGVRGESDDYTDILAALQRSPLAERSPTK